MQALMEPTLEARLAEREPPARETVMYQKWRNLLFVHWAWATKDIQASLPPGLTVDTFENRAYLGVVPFFVEDMHLPFLPPIPGLSSMLELNVRTYVYDKLGRPGVWFYSLDANHPIAVATARRLFHLNYQNAAMKAVPSDPYIIFSCRRDGLKELKISEFTYATRGPLGLGPPGSLEFFLTERYRLFAWDEKSRTLLSARVHHAPYVLSDAELTRYDQVMLALNGFSGHLRPPEHRLFSPGVDVSVHAPETIE
jgi:uncharacterized protein